MKLVGQVGMGFITLLLSLLEMGILQAQSINFLGISPDTRSAAMGNVSAATSPDANAVFWNTARNAFNKNSFEVAVSYSPWLRELNSDMKLTAIGTHISLSDRHSLNVGLRHFSFGKLHLMDEAANFQGVGSPYEFGSDIGYAFRVLPNFSLSLTPKYVSTSLSTLSSASRGKMSSFAIDLGSYVKHDIFSEKGKAVMSYGLVVSQVGSLKNGNVGSLHLPTVLRGGLSLNYAIDPTSAVVIATDINKNFNDDTYVGGLPSNGGVGFGSEYLYKDILAVRLGYSLQKYGERDLNNVTTGVMLGYQGWHFGFAYLIPTFDHHALNNTMRFSVTYAKK